MKQLGTLAAILLVAASLFATQTTTVGILTDSMCMNKHMMQGKSNADCVRTCVKDGAKYVVVAGGKVLELKGNADQFSALAGKKVKLTGEQKGNVVVVSSIEAAQ
jgi:hypothetical protein